MGKFFFKFPELRPEEIRIDVTYLGICHSDSMFMQEEWIPINNYPCAPGHEILGVVKAVGSNVTNFKIGDKVGFGCQRWACGHCKGCSATFDNLCSSGCDQKWTYGDLYWGGYATGMQQPADFFFKIPDNITVSDEHLPSLFCAACTVFGAIERHVKPGDRVAVLGIGGLGHLAIQFAKAWGCKVSAFTRTTNKIDKIKMVCDNIEIFDTNNPKVFEDQQSKYDVVIQCLPISDNQYLSKELDLLDTFGKFVIVGGASRKDPMMVDIFLCHLKHISILFNWIGSRKEIHETMEFAMKHNIWPTVELWDFEDLPKAYDKVLGGRPIFRGVVKAQGYLESLVKK
jgi:D-arabinose 1-dehydrogenase-like Zn-dependent alcohol dehydrogenase